MPCTFIRPSRRSSRERRTAHRAGVPQAFRFDAPLYSIPTPTMIIAMPETSEPCISENNRATIATPKETMTTPHEESGWVAACRHRRRRHVNRGGKDRAAETQDEDPGQVAAYVHHPATRGSHGNAREQQQSHGDVEGAPDGRKEYAESHRLRGATGPR